MKLRREFDWSVLIAAPQPFIEMTQQGGRLNITTEKLDSLFASMPFTRPEWADSGTRRDAFSLIVDMYPLGHYSPAQISEAVNIYLNHFGGNPIASTAAIFECSSQDIVHLHFAKQDNNGL